MKGSPKWCNDLFDSSSASPVPSNNIMLAKERSLVLWSESAARDGVRKWIRASIMPLREKRTKEDELRHILEEKKKTRFR